MSQHLDLLARVEAATADLRALLTADEPIAPPPPPAVAPQAAAPDPPGHGLADPGRFFDALRAGKALGPTLSAGEVSGCEVILTACGGFPVSWAAYCLATPVIETNGTMQPIREMGGTAYFQRYDIAGPRPDKARELGNLTPGDGARYCGRGYAQMTGRTNYARAEKELGVPLVADPDLAMQPDVAAKILRLGMSEGWFTGKTLATYLPAVADIHQFANARRIINGLDRAAEIAGHALEFQTALQAGGWQ